MTPQQKFDALELLEKQTRYFKVVAATGLTMRQVRKLAREHGLQSKLGVGSCSPEERTRIAKIGGRACSSIPGQMSAIGVKGGKVVSADFAHMSKIGRRGGIKVSRDVSHMREIGSLGGKARLGKTYPKAEENEEA